MAIEDLKYYMTSDEQFIIDINKIMFMSKYIVPLTEIKDLKYNSTNTTYYNDYMITQSYFNVYMDGIESPITLKYNDGMVLYDILAKKYSIYKNTYNVGIENLTSNNTNYKFTKYSNVITPPSEGIELLENLSTSEYIIAQKL